MPDKRTSYTSGSFLLLILLCAMLMLQCTRNYTPKPRGFLRFDLPDKEYTLFDTTFPYRFEYPIYASVVKDPAVEDKMMVKRFNVEFPDFKGTLHLSYESLGNQHLDTLIEEAVEFVYKHVPKATTITKKHIFNKEENIFATIFTIKGKYTASTYQFYLTDSVSNFMRGALYLNTQPNNDSLKPVIEFLKQDVDHFISTLQWK